MFNSNQRGQTLLELVVVIAVSVMVIGALVFATIASLRNAQFAKNQAQATKYAQEGIERVRTGRDRSALISAITNCSQLTSWSNIWSCQITGGCDVPAVGLVAANKCYFTVSSAGALTYINSSTSFPQDLAEPLPSAEEPIFRRVITLSDDPSTNTTQKTVTAIVTWTDFSGPHESKLTTILRKL